MNVELIKEVVVPVFKPRTVKVTITTQEEYDAIQLAGNSLIRCEIKAMPDCIPYSLSEREVWVDLLTLISKGIQQG